VRILRDELFLGSERAIPVDAPLGDLGVGLDSLALVSLLSAVEDAFGVELPEDIWIAREPLTVNGLAEIVRTTPKAAVTQAPVDRPSPVLHGRLERIEDALVRRGPAGRAAWAAVRFAVPAMRFLYSDTRHLLLERRLDDAASTVLAPPAGIDLRQLTTRDEADLVDLWTPVRERTSQRILERSLREGAIALAACESGRVVALDLLSARGDAEVDVVSPDACYGFLLTEAPRARGRGIGLALLAYSFAVSRERGFRRQFTHVLEGNTAMLASATQLLGFRMTGIARRRRVAGVTRWSWKVDGMQGRGPRLVL
jgi:acyl carrier protein/GNAT superfamily N-acetyltransferase